ncbi:FtsK/SpoIIIE domain-containing protein [Leifsonia sp. Root112D2]|uniref:FtsK/SpoIIIE domain-containing protein n=1 Tax=Leifsonia sp. Root112D2 TaxID=1736426 RepID=UPI0007022F03|nr:FtsK/SpoIIIE domain-containing protein [Leifsonia sp. Root112D2]KQV05214.1 hypothetical protein ASC63_15650 [Leifsonia sp. Root112D2]
MTIEPLTLPEHPPDPHRGSFPLVASVAPLIAACAIWAITRSPFALVFAALSPIVAVAGMVDGRWHARRQRRKHRIQVRRQTARLREQIVLRHDDERTRRAHRYPPAAALLRDAEGDITRWRGGRADSGATTLALGLGTVRSELSIGGSPRTDDERQLCASATSLGDAVVVTDAAAGLGIVGPVAQARAVARGYLVQLVHALSPELAGLAVVPHEGWEWAAGLPHAAGGRKTEIRIEVREKYRTTGVEGNSSGARAASVESARRSQAGDVPGASAAPLVIALADSIEALPTSCRTVVRIVGAGNAELIGAEAISAGGEAVGEGAGLALELVTAAEAERFVRVLRRHAAAAGISAMRGVPPSVRFAQLAVPAGLAGPKTKPGSLDCVIGLDESGVRMLDLVSQGPHAVVGGTTGSGKSELLITWVTAMAAAHTPDEVTFLLIDFKGGAAFAPLTALPHTVGVMTDLDHVAASRALASLGAELRSRERTLAQLKATDIADPACRGRLARLVIVVDEFAAMLEALPELHAVLSDVAARGRSLGVHLILCTQRPAGAMRDALLANCGLRLSLRVNNRADSQAVVGTDAAAALPATNPGRCIIGSDGATALVQIAVTEVDDIDAIARATHAADAAARESGAQHVPARARRPWLDPLPAEIPLGTLIAGAEGSNESLVLGVEDVPEEQRQSVVRYCPRLEGSLLVLGAQHSGKSTMLSSLAAQSGFSGAVLSLGDTAERRWDALRWASERCSGHDLDDLRQGETRQTLLLADDIDSVYSRLPGDYQQEFVEMLSTVLRDGPAAGIRLVVTVQRLVGALGSLAALFGAQLVLRMPNRQEHLLAGADATLYEETLRPGGACWKGHRVQLALPETEENGRPRQRGARKETAPLLAFEPGSVLLLVTRAPARRLRELQAALGAGAVVTGLDARSTDVASLDVSSTSAGSPASVIVGDPDAWQARWSLLGTLRTRGMLAFDGCTPAEVRAIARTRALPPLLGPERDRVWLCDAEGHLSRARLPTASLTAVSPTTANAE